jgi:predicted site-specific integrase-resolvase
MTGGGGSGAIDLLGEHKDCLTRFGFHALELLAEAQGKRIGLVNETESPKGDLIDG